MPFGNFQRDFAHTMDEGSQRDVYERHTVPAPGRIYFQNGLAIASAISRGNGNRAPFLLIAGLFDRTVEPAIVKATLRKYRRFAETTELKEFPNRTHFPIASPRWEEIADYCIEWGESRLAAI